MTGLLIPTANGQLAGVLHTPAEPGYSKTTLIICHGFRGSKEGGGRAVSLAEKACKLGLYVIRFDFTPATVLTRQVDELAAVVQYAVKHIGGNILLLGRSMGGSAALAYTAAAGKIAGLCLWATPWGLEETFRLALGESYGCLERGEAVSLDDEYGQATITPAFIGDFKNYDLLGSVRTLRGLSLLQVHGDCDAIVPLRQAYEINQAAAVTKKLVVIEGGDHHLAAHAEVAAQAVLDWLQTVI